MLYEELAYTELAYTEPTWLSDTEFALVETREDGRTSLLVADVTRPDAE